MAEIQLQASCYQWFHNHFPEQRGLLHANNNNSVNAIKGNQMKAIGVVAGVADMEYCKGGKTFFIEMKKPGGKQSEKQRKFQALVEIEGFEYIIIDDQTEFEAFILRKQTTSDIFFG